MAESSPDSFDQQFDAMLAPRSGVAGMLRHFVDPRTWSRTDWIVTIAPLVVEAAAIGAPEVTLPIIGAVDLGRAFKLVTSSMAGRTAMTAAATGLGERIQGGEWTDTGEAAAGGALANILGEGTAGVGKLVGRSKMGNIRERTLGQTSKMLRDSISKKLPLLAHGLEGAPAAKLKQTFGRQHLLGHGSPAERLYGDALQQVEDHIERNMHQPGKGPLVGFNARGQAVRRGAHTVEFPVHEIRGGQWVTVKKPFKEAVAAMREKWPMGYRLTGAERDTATAEEWRKFRAQDSRAIGAHLKTVDPKLAEQWQTARHDWELASTFGDMFSDPQAMDPVTGEVNTEQMAKHMYGGVGKVAQKPHIARVAGNDFANKIHGAITHQKPSENMKDISDIIKRPDEAKARVGVSPHFPFVHLSMHPPSGEFFPQGTQIPLKEIGRPKVPFSILRALGRHGAVQAGEGFFGEDDAGK